MRFLFFIDEPIIMNATAVLVSCIRQSIIREMIPTPFMYNVTPMGRRHR